MAEFETIHALSSGSPPAAIAIVRLSGGEARRILIDLAGQCPMPRQATLCALRDRHGDLLDRALILWFPAPRSVTGEDVVELHLHGGRAVVEAVLAALEHAGSRLAQPGEFTRRALMNGRLDLGAVEGLADLLAAETEYQRREALRRADGALGRRLAGWSNDLLAIAAQYEAMIDYDGDIEPDSRALTDAVARLLAEIDAALSRISMERLRDGLRVAIVGPVNAGKSSLFNALVGSDAAIVSAIAGTTRDLVERPVAIDGIPLVLIDTAGVRHATDEIERIGIDRAIAARANADIVIDLEGRANSRQIIAVTAKADLVDAHPDTIAVSVVTGRGLDRLAAAIVQAAKALLPGEGEVAINRRYRSGLEAVRVELERADRILDPILAAEHIRLARLELDRLTGTAGFEDVLDTLFSRFCLGK